MEKLRRKILEDNKLLAKFTVFAELNEDELHTLIEQSATESYSSGERIITAGDSGHCMYVILSGGVSVTVKRGNGEIELARLFAGDFFGEVAMLGETGRRMAVVLATSDMRVAVMFGAEFRLMENEFPQVLERLRTEMQRRLEIAGLA